LSQGKADGEAESSAVNLGNAVLRNIQTHKQINNSK
jgi:hypothetical protein